MFSFVWQRQVISPGTQAPLFIFLSAHAHLQIPQAPSAHPDALPSSGPSYPPHMSLVFSWSSLMLTSKHVHTLTRLFFLLSTFTTLWGVPAQPSSCLINLFWTWCSLTYSWSGFKFASKYRFTVPRAKNREGTVTPKQPAHGLWPAVMLQPLALRPLLASLLLVLISSCFLGRGTHAPALIPVSATHFHACTYRSRQ